MNIGNRTIPFEVTDISYGLKEAKGLVKLNENGFELEYRLQDSFVGIVKSDTKSTVIPYSNLEEITFEKGWFSSKIILEGTSMDAFRGLPGTEPGSRTLKIKRRHRDEAEKLVSRARMRLSEYRLNKMEGEG